MFHSLVHPVEATQPDMDLAPAQDLVVVLDNDQQENCLTEENSIGELQPSEPKVGPTQVSKPQNLFPYRMYDRVNH